MNSGVVSGGLLFAGGWLFIIDAARHGSLPSLFVGAVLVGIGALVMGWWWDR